VFVGLSRGLYLIENLLASGDPLSEVQREIERGLAFAQKAQLAHVVSIIQTHLELVRTLRGLTRKFGSFDDEGFDDARFARNPNSALAEWLYCMRKVQAHFHAGDYASAIDAATRAQRYTASGYLYQVADLRFYSALSHAAVCDTADQREAHFAVLSAHHRQLGIWAEQCPENFENRAALVGAEIARLEGRDVDAMRLYQQGIHSARVNSFVQNEALAYELAARFYAARGFDEIANLYLQNARYGYQRWGADGKVRQLDEMYPQLRKDQLAAAPTSTIGAPVEHLDLATVIKVSQAVSSEIVLETLIDTLMRTAIEQAGAERGLLIVPRAAGPWIEAEATTGGDMVVVELRDQPVTAAVLPESVLQYVLRTRESVILDDAAAQPLFAADPYLRQRQARSILCVPLVKQSRLIGVLYLENNLASHVFTPARISVLELLASQAAISLENAQLYNDLQEREAKIRRLVDSNIVGIVIWDFQGRIIDANQAFLDMVGYAREDLVSGRLRWPELTPAEWRDADDQAIAEQKALGTLQPREKEYLRKDGGRVPVLVARALFERKPDEGVSFVVDMTDRKRAEEKLRASERRLLDAQMELAHVTRVTTLGEMTASIAHEVNQPLAAVAANAEACLRWLDRATPNLDEARRSVEWVINDNNRASEVIWRVRALAKKTEIEQVPLDIKDVVKEVNALVRSELVSHQVLLRTEFAPSLPLILADRVQLQQVIINLVMNGIEAMQSVTDRPRELVIRSRQDEKQQVLVSVTDCGVGIPAENAGRMFQAFFTTKSGGMGMGLSICRSIIEAQGGRLWATEVLPHGATFQFTLPVNADHAS
jgi:PAS domain S-box-containing protein